jgi:hypothetical protein
MKILLVMLQVIHFEHIIQFMIRVIYTNINNVLYCLLYLNNLYIVQDTFTIFGVFHLGVFIELPQCIPTPVYI